MYKSKYNKAKSLYHASLKNNFEKDLEISRLKNLETRSAVSHQTNEARQSNEAHKYENYRKDFQDIELVKLRSIEDDCKNDATFIRLMLMYIYKDNLGILSNRSVKGTKVRVKRRKIDGMESEINSTEPLSPLKLKILSGVFAERLSKSKESEKVFRTEKFNQLVAKAICYLRTA